MWKENEKNCWQLNKTDSSKRKTREGIEAETVLLKEQVQKPSKRRRRDDLESDKIINQPLISSIFSSTAVHQTQPQGDEPPQLTPVDDRGAADSPNQAGDCQGKEEEAAETRVQDKAVKVDVQANAGRQGDKLPDIREDLKSLRERASYFGVLLVGTKEVVEEEAAETGKEAPAEERSQGEPEPGAGIPGKIGTNDDDIIVDKEKESDKERKKSEIQERKASTQAPEIEGKKKNQVLNYSLK